MFISRLATSSSRNFPARKAMHDVFISHRGVDTRRTVAGLLYDRLVQLDLRPFLAAEEEKVGRRVKAAIAGSKVGVAVFSPTYCESYSCLREVAMMVEMRKKMIPVFCDVKPSEVRLSEKQRGLYSPEKVERFDRALEEARFTVGIAFDSKNGNYSELVSRTEEIVLKNVRRDKRG